MPAVAFRAAPNRKRLGFVASADGARSAAVLVLPKTWRSGPPSARRVAWPADGHLTITVYEGDVVVVEGDAVQCEVLRKWLVEVQVADPELLELLVALPGTDRSVDASHQTLEPILDLLELFDRCSISLVEDELPHSAERHQLVRLVLYRRFISIVEPLIGRLRPQYREREDVLATPRGRILDRSIVVTLASRVPTVECRFDEHSHATDLAVVLLAAIRTVARQGGTARTSSLFRPLQDRAARLARQLEGVPAVDRRVAYRMSRSLRLGRLEAEFATALALARRVLRDDVPTPGAGGDLPLETFRVGVPTEKLWEAALQQALACVPAALTYVNADNKPATSAVEVPAPWTAGSTPTPSERFPDFLVLVGSTASSCLWCVDAKYKDTPARSPAADDANQLFVYSHLAAVAGRRVERCALVYPSTSPRGVRSTLKRERDHTIPLFLIEALFPERGDLRTQRAWEDYVSRTAVGLAHVLVP